MSGWTDTLERFSDAIRTGTGFAPGEIVCPRYPDQRGIEVYRNNHRGNLHDALAGAYPVIRQLVGEEFFRLLARHFIERHPSRSGDLHRYGAGMAEFLAHFEPVRRLAYLPDMAKLEWAYHRAYFAADTAPFDLTRLAGIAPEAYAALTWRLHPSCTLLASAFPIMAIWQAHQDGPPAALDIDLDSGGASLLVCRNGLDGAIFNIAPDSHCWLEQLQQGSTLETATETTLSAHPGFDLASTLHRWLELGVLTDFDMAQEESR
ncbi:hypothetical protein MIZ01_2544 [Sideroxyarcus emersonii]|uniref:Putative DNA-binding domain-containing protein n=1 Tax=Sideroxyarcus emersonii TaxID=2764705 RepID=A0AAN1XCB3_9PROT|nr:DNA-binding domain-containing protein [Sideroxyarcus emersonii]BCK88738.1 hypothetical protein MIZ01_2544 [Sideroxyarcus emersonii]